MLVISVRDIMRICIVIGESLEKIVALFFNVSFNILNGIFSHFNSVNLELSTDRFVLLLVKMFI